MYLASGVALLRPEDQVFEAMLDGWRNQQLARNLAFSTIEGRENRVRAFARHAEAFPWRWTPQLADDWFSDLRAVRGNARSTLRSYQEALRAFCGYLIDPAYQWARECETRFGTHPVQVCHEWNTAVHVQEAEAEPAKRAFTIEELQAFFDHADEQVTAIRGKGRKGWLPAFRDAALLKTAYAFGLRRNETRMLDVVDFGRNPEGAEFGEHGVLCVRFGKAMKGSPPKRRSVLTVWAWSSETIEQWVTEVRPLLAAEGNPALWPSERGPRVGLQRLNSRFVSYRDALGLDAGLDFHSLRRSYVTHLIEDGFDALFVQQQVGHEHASTTSIYTCVSPDFRTRTLRRVLDQTMTAALGQDRSTP
jgi:integrase/recombinase XerC